MHRLISASLLMLAFLVCQATMARDGAPSGPALQVTAATKTVMGRNLQGFGCLSPDGAVVVLRHSSNAAPVHAFSLKDGAQLWKSAFGEGALVGCFDQGAALISPHGAKVFDYVTGKSKALVPQSPFADECKMGMSAVPWSQKGEVGFVYRNSSYPGSYQGSSPLGMVDDHFPCCATGMASAKGQSLVVKPLDEAMGADAKCSQHQLVAVPGLKSEALPKFQVPGRELSDPSEAFDVGQGRTLIFSFAEVGCVPEIVLSLREGQKLRWQTPTGMYFGSCPFPFP